MKHIGMARLGRDAEVRYTPQGDAVANLSLAVTVYDKTAENNRGTQWIDASIWGKQAESLAQYLVKGSLHCFTLSDMRIEEYEGRNGTGHKLVARVDNVELGPRQGDAPATTSARPTVATKTQGGQVKQTEIPDDDIPF